MIPKKPELRIGRAYFMCGYYLQNLPTPEIETWIYIGANIFEGDATEDEIFHYFEHPTSYYSGKNSEENSESRKEEPLKPKSELQPTEKIRVSDNDLEALVYDYRKLCEWVVSLENDPNADKAF